MTLRALVAIFSLLLLAGPVEAQSTQWIGSTVGAGGGGGGAAIDPTTTDLTMGAGLQIFAEDGTAADPAFTYSSDPNTGLTLSSTAQQTMVLGGFNYSTFSTGNFRVLNSMGIGWSANSGDSTVGHDLLLYRDAANILALRNGAAAQTSRVYETYTDAANNQGLSIDAGVTTANEVTLSPFENGTGSNNIAMVVKSIGTSDIELDAGGADVFFHNNGTRLGRLLMGAGSTDTNLLHFNAPNGGNDSAGTQSMFKFSGVFLPATGTPTEKFMYLEPTINWGGTPGAGNYEALFINAIETAVPTGTNYLIRAQIDAADVFGVESDGDLVLTGEVSIEGSPGVDCTSAAAVTVINGIVTACS